MTQQDYDDSYDDEIPMDIENALAIAEMSYVKPHLQELCRLIKAGSADKTKDEALLSIRQMDSCQESIRKIWPDNGTTALESIISRSGDYALLTDHYASLGVF